MCFTSMLLITNTKWHIGFQITWKSLTLDNLEGHSQPVRSAILATAISLSAGLVTCVCYVRDFLKVQNVTTDTWSCESSH